MGAARRLRVGIFFNARMTQGGLYQYALTLVDCLHRFVPEFDYSLYHATLEEFPLNVARENWRYCRLPKRAIQIRLGLEAFLLNAARVGVQIPFSVIPEYREVKKDRLDVMIYAKPGVHPFQWRYPAVFPIHDLQHRLQPCFPEVSKHGEYQRREYFYRKSIPRAAAILTDSETGSEDVVNCYGVEKGKLFSIPYIPPTFVDTQTTPGFLENIKKKYSLPAGYLFYPAAFWTHKNHVLLIKALTRIVQEHHVRIPLILAGGKSREYFKLETLVSELDLKDMVRFVGYVPDEDMAALYSQSIALVMPTYFGPTNIPVLEAWSAGCAVITSDLRGIREQVGDAGLLINPASEKSIADAIWSLYTSPQLRKDLIQRGKIRVRSLTAEKFAQKLAIAIRHAVKK